MPASFTAMGKKCRVRSSYSAGGVIRAEKGEKRGYAYMHMCVCHKIACQCDRTAETHTIM